MPDRTEREKLVEALQEVGCRHPDNRHCRERTDDPMKWCIWCRALAAADLLSEEGERRIEGCAFLDGDCFHTTEDGECLEPSWTFVENGEPEDEGDYAAVLVLLSGPVQEASEP